MLDLGKGGEWGEKGGGRTLNLKQRLHDIKFIKIVRLPKLPIYKIIK